MAEPIKFDELSNVGTLKASAITAVVQETSGAIYSQQASMAQVADLVVNSIEYQDLSSEDKTVIGAINEALAGGGGGGGTTVVPNPTGDATAELSKIKINGTIYSLANSNVYSTEEIPIGKWIDGKTIYQKTIDIGTLPNNSTKLIEAPYIDFLIVYSGIVYNTTTISPDAPKRRQRPIPLPTHDANCIRVDYQENSIRIVTYASWAGYEGVLTIQYTKNEVEL